jgi:hypothetical protein
MADQWEIRGPEFVMCNCNWGCPCQFGAPSTHGHCEAIVGGHIEQGRFNATSLDGLNWALLLQWPGEIADGNGKSQVIVDERAGDAQFEALRKILHGESTAPGATHFFVFNSTMTEVLETLRAPIEANIDVEGRTASIDVAGLVQAKGRPIIDAFSGNPARSRIHLPNGFEYTYAEMGTGTSSSTAGISMTLDGTYGAFCELHMNQDGVIR